MKHFITIMSTSYGMDDKPQCLFEDKLEIDEEEILDILLKRWIEEHESSIDENKKYKALLDKTEH